MSDNPTREMYNRHLQGLLQVDADDLRKRLERAEREVRAGRESPPAPADKGEYREQPIPLHIQLRQRPRPVRRQRLPAPPALHRVEYRYEAHLQRVLDPLRSAVEGKVLTNYESWLQSAKERQPDTTDSLRMDFEFETIAAIFNWIKMGILERETETSFAARKAAEQVASSIDGQNKKFHNELAQRVLGVDPFKSEPWLLPETRNWIAENVSLIKSVGQQYLTDVEKLMYQMLREGKSIKEVRNELQAKFNVSKARARLIARDQVNKYNGQLTRARQTQIGVNEYTWTTVQDQRVRGPVVSGGTHVSGTIGGKYPKARPAHTVMEGVRCRWDNPNVYWDEGKGKWVPRTGLMPKAHPGQEIQCRCVAMPVLPNWMVT